MVVPLDTVGAVQVNVNDELVAVTAPSVGAGAVETAPVFTLAVVGAPLPTELVAATVTVYVTPFARPVKVVDSVEADTFWVSTAPVEVFVAVTV